MRQHRKASNVCFFYFVPLPEVHCVTWTAWANVQNSKIALEVLAKVSFYAH